GVRSCYDEGKRCAETLFFDYHRQNKVDIRVARIFNTYGARMQPDDGRVVSNFIIQALKNENITIYGDGSQTRSFCYIDDMVEGLIKLMESDEIGPINLGNPNEISIKEIAEKIVTFSKSSSKISYHKLPEDDPVRRQPNIDLAKRILNWNPTITLDEGLQKTIAYFMDSK
ncbi:MAG: GDP-mannose 4,6-dehydratase, partial [Candidatus Marinimicrobia bacterium]|nr:GDP-mannose 4,6-dehydratase [Candidatus Neomarinimicrobiota bacterium]